MDSDLGPGEHISHDLSSSGLSSSQDRETSPENFKYSVFSKASEKHPERNEDTFLCLPEKNTFAVFDGVGGFIGGELAAHTAMAYIGGEICNMPSGLSFEETQEYLNKIMMDAHQKVVDNRNAIAESVINDNYRKMQTTAILAHFWTGPKGEVKIIVVNSGDSRAYISAGRLVLVTDGVSDNLTAGDFAEVLTKRNLDISETASALVNKAADASTDLQSIRKKKDDMTAVVVAIPGIEASEVSGDEIVFQITLDDGGHDFRGLSIMEQWRTQLLLNGVKTIDDYENEIYGRELLEKIYLNRNVIHNALGAESNHPKMFLVNDVSRPWDLQMVTVDQKYQVNAKNGEATEIRQSPESERLPIGSYVNIHTPANDLDFGWKIIEIDPNTNRAILKKDSETRNVSLSILEDLNVPKGSLDDVTDQNQFLAYIEAHPPYNYDTREELEDYLRQVQGVFNLEEPMFRITRSGGFREKAKGLILSMLPFEKGTYVYGYDLSTSQYSKKYQVKDIDVDTGTVITSNSGGESVLFTINDLSGYNTVRENMDQVRSLSELITYKFNNPSSDTIREVVRIRAFYNGKMDANQSRLDKETLECIERLMEKKLQHP